MIVYYAVIPVMIVAVNMSGFMLGEVVRWTWGGGGGGGSTLLK